jgi:hypothetical protein
VQAAAVALRNAGKSDEAIDAVKSFTSKFVTPVSLIQLAEAAISSMFL